MRFFDSFGADSFSARIITIGAASKLPPQDLIEQHGGEVVASGESAFIIFCVDVPSSQSQLTAPKGEDSDQMQQLDHHLGETFERLDSLLNLGEEFMEGYKADWYPLVVTQDPAAERVDYQPTMEVNYNLAIVRFSGRAPSETNLIRTVCRALLQWHVMMKALAKAREAAAVATTTSNRDLHANVRSLEEARHDLLTSIVSFDVRIDCYEFLDFDFADRVRSAWQLDAFEAMVKWSLDACGDRLRVISDLQQERGRRTLRIVLAVLTFASALTAILTVVDFSTSDVPLDADSVGRIITALGVVALAIVVGLQLHRKGLS